MNSGVWIRLRPAVVALAAVLLVHLLTPGGAGAGRKAQVALTTLELSTIDSINALRVSHGVEPLSVSPALFGSATLHCEQMVEGGYFGGNPVTVVTVDFGVRR